MSFQKLSKNLAKIMIVTFPLFFDFLLNTLKIHSSLSEVFASCLQDGKHKTFIHQNKSMSFEI